MWIWYKYSAECNVEISDTKQQAIITKGQKIILFEYTSAGVGTLKLIPNINDDTVYIQLTKMKNFADSTFKNYTRNVISADFINKLFEKDTKEITDKINEMDNDKNKNKKEQDKEMEFMDWFMEGKKDKPEEQNPNKNEKWPWYYWLEIISAIVLLISLPTDYYFDIFQKEEIKKDEITPENKEITTEQNEQTEL
jgi:hypothetical protein